MTGSVVTCRQTWCWRGNWQLYVWIDRQQEEREKLWTWVEHLKPQSWPPPQWHTSTNKNTIPNNVTSYKPVGAPFIETTKGSVTLSSSIWYTGLCIFFLLFSLFLSFFFNLFFKFTKEFWSVKALPINKKPSKVKLLFQTVLLMSAVGMNISCRPSWHHTVARSCFHFPLAYKVQLCLILKHVWCT